jgi:hypothetical protein
MFSVQSDNANSSYHVPEMCFNHNGASARRTNGEDSYHLTGYQNTQILWSHSQALISHEPVIHVTSVEFEVLRAVAPECCLVGCDTMKSGGCSLTCFQNVGIYWTIWYHIHRIALFTLHHSNEHCVHLNCFLFIFVLSQKRGIHQKLMQMI